MMKFPRRTLLSALGVSLPFGLKIRADASPAPVGPAPTLELRSFEEVVRKAFATRQPAANLEAGSPVLVRWVEVGDSDLIRSGVQGCHNDRPFAGFPAGHLRILRANFRPGPAVQGVRLYVSSVEVALTEAPISGDAFRPLNFATLPHAPSLG